MKELLKNYGTVFNFKTINKGTGTGSAKKIGPIRLFIKIVPVPVFL